MPKAIFRVEVLDEETLHSLYTWVTMECDDPEAVLSGNDNGYLMGAVLDNLSIIPMSYEIDEEV